ncbi:kinase-like protein [Panus rudis PR-1116 ss-1]|nr:kinase-like protein [Panus rudis PR-1116 ss-1]
MPLDEVVQTSTVEVLKHPDGKYVNQYQFVRQLGKGQHGEVFQALDRQNNRMVVRAIKQVKRKNPKIDRMSQLRRKNLPSSPHVPLTDNLGTTEHKIRKEIAIMKKCRHPHVVRLLEVIDDKLDKSIYMVMEYLGGGEIKWRTPDDRPTLRVSQIRRICRDVILGLEYLHNQGIIHRDIKPANLLWTEDRRMVKIADFGVSHFSYAQRLAAASSSARKGGQDRDSDLDPLLMDDSDLSKFAGTPMFLAPEIVYDSSSVVSSNANTPGEASSAGESQAGSSTPTLRKPPITKAIDVWAFGVTLYGLLFGHLPFRGSNEFQIYNMIRTEDWDVPETMGSDEMPTGGRHPDWEKAKNDERYIEGYWAVDLLEKLLTKDVGRRITLDGVKVGSYLLFHAHIPSYLVHITTFTDYMRALYSAIHG